MNRFAKYAVAALVAIGAVAGAAAPAEARVVVAVGVGGPVYYGYNYSRPCSYYYRHDLPAPRRCYSHYRRYYGSHVYISSGFVFLNRTHYYRWHRRDDFRHWRNHNWRRHH